MRARWQPSEAYLLDHNGVMLDSARIDYGVRRFDWITLDAISTALIDAVVDGEDRRFWTHHGVDWRAATRRRARQPDGRTTARRQHDHDAVGGNAAISANARHHRGWLDKIEQVRAARAIESNWTKPQILEAYLNLLGFRGELEGIDAAARLLAGKMPSGLSVPESLVLAALLPQPGANLARIDGARLRPRAADAIERFVRGDRSHARVRCSTAPRTCRMRPTSPPISRVRFSNVPVNAS